MGNISKFLIPIPPLAEQHRIVAKVDELIAICDQLKAKLQQSQETQVQLTDALVDKALGWVLVLEQSRFICSSTTKRNKQDLLLAVIF